MDIVTALAVTIGVLGGLATWAAVSLGSAFVLIWAIFVAWGSFYHCGGKENGLQSSLIGNIWGIICAVAAFIALTAMGVSALNAGICVGVTVLIMILGAKLPMLGAIPAAVYGYASTAALFLLGGAAYGEGAGGIVKVGLAVAISMAIGAVLGLISEKVAGMLSGASKPSGKYVGGCDHVHTVSNADPIDNHTCHCSVCKGVTGQLTTHVVFFKHGDLHVSNPANLNRQPFNAANPKGPLELCTCKTCGTPIMLDDKEKRIRVIVPNLMGHDTSKMPATYHAFYDPKTGNPKPNDGRPIYEGLRPEFVWPKPS